MVDKSEPLYDMYFKGFLIKGWLINSQHMYDKTGIRLAAIVFFNKHNGNRKHGGQLNGYFSN